MGGLERWMEGRLRMGGGYEVGDGSNEVEV